MNVCCICDGDIEIEESGWSIGHNARPVKKGRCCQRCNWTVVIPVRLKNAFMKIYTNGEKDENRTEEK
jgi:hypothetical protein